MALTMGCVLWFTGLSGAGKSTLAAAVAQALAERKARWELLDGDHIREHLNKGLGFSRADRDTNVLRVGFVAELLAKHDVIAIAALISPYRHTRAQLKQRLPHFLEVFVDCPLDECIRRDVKGLYARALAGELSQFTGISDPYEAPEAPDLVVHTDRDPLETCVERVLNLLEARGYLRP